MRFRDRVRPALRHAGRPGLLLLAAALLLLAASLLSPAAAAPAPC